MTEAEQVLIRGKCFLYRQKAPFVPSGKSVHGALEYREKSDEVRCHECGGWFRLLGQHAFRAHGLRSYEYRKKHGLRRKCALCGPRLACEMRTGKEEYYQRLRETTQSPEWRTKFGAMARATASKRRYSPPTDVAERLNESGHCRAQLTQRLKELQERYGEIPTKPELIQHGISPSSVCLAFNLPNITEVLKSLELTQASNGYTREALIEILLDFWAKYKRLPGRAHERMGLVPRWQQFKRVFGSITAAYEAAGLSKATESYRRETLRDVLIDKMQKFYQKHRKLPMASRKYGRRNGDTLPPGFPSRKTFNRIFGSMSAAYEAAGLGNVTGTECCLRYLVRTGRGVMDQEGRFITHPNHCRDGERVRCSECWRTWQHFCDEAEGCSWLRVPNSNQFTKQEVVDEHPPHHDA